MPQDNHLVVMLARAAGKVKEGGHLGPLRVEVNEANEVHRVY